MEEQPTGSKMAAGPQVTARLVHHPIHPSAVVDGVRQGAPGHGALVSFEGAVRPVTKQGETLEHLILDHHPRMTEPSLVEIAHSGAARFDVAAINVAHRAGTLAPGEIIVCVTVASDHRREAFQCADYLMDRLKTDAVFWKRERGAFGERWIEPTGRDTLDRQRWSDENAGH